MATIGIPYFDGSEVDVEMEFGDDGSPTKQAEAALAAFISLTPADRRRDSRHVYAYYQDFREAVGATSLDEDIGVPESVEAIWSYVTPGGVHISKSRHSDGHYYVEMEAECEWEPEHGLMMVWRDGRTLCKVGGYNGHMTNVDAYGDKALADVVYSSIDKRFRTFLDK